MGLTQLIEIEMRRGEAGLNSPVGHPGAAAGRARSDGPSHVAFWLRPVSLFGRFGVTSPASLHVVQPSTSPLAALRIRCARERVGYKAPEVVIVLDKMPINATGKVDRATLKKWAAERVSAEHVA